MKESKPLTTIGKRRRPEVILADLREAGKAVEYFSKMAVALPRKLYNKRASHKKAAFVAEKSGKHRRSKHTKFTLKLLEAQFRFGNLMEEYEDSQRNYTLKKRETN